MLKKIAIVIAVLVAAVLALATTKPDTINVQRTATINAPADKIFPLINDFHRWGTWSPWEKKDPAMKRVYAGALTGTGSTYLWDGNSQVGMGKMTILESVPSSKVGIQLDFLKPFEGHNIAEFKLVPHGNSTDVTWSMHGPNNYLGKVMCVFFNPDKMIGGDFEAGLANIKREAEKKG